MALSTNRKASELCKEKTRKSRLLTYQVIFPQFVYLLKSIVSLLAKAVIATSKNYYPVFGLKNMP